MQRYHKYDIRADQRFALKTNKQKTNKQNKTRPIQKTFEKCTNTITRKKLEQNRSITDHLQRGKTFKATD